jgi:hypothetical protein
MEAKHTPAAVVAAAKELSKRAAADCNVDADDMWKTYGDDYLRDAEAALEASGFSDLLQALKELTEIAEEEWGGYPEMTNGFQLLARARAAISKATGEQQ